ncbi:hypothetical protein [Bacillus sp. T33-2]|uniref:hypothetical protein n=1 Tax=Bacillus sp. T33-2 TaxID=2054168 RepID=UPI0015E155CE|nr:hypothetical protein [Bacillus sp. T33-2]
MNLDGHVSTNPHHYFPDENEEEKAPKADKGSYSHSNQKIEDMPPSTKIQYDRHP